MNTIFFIITAALILIAFIAIFRKVIKEVIAVRENASLELRDKVIYVETACAGSDELTLMPVTKPIRALEIDTFKDKNGNILDPDNYRPFIVQGESMQFCGIRHNNLIFTDINFNIEDYNTVFPVVLVLLRSKVLGDRPQYKIRRTWKVTKYTNDENLLLEISQIINSSSFQEIRNLDVYDGDSAVINDFNQTRLPLYKREYVECDNPNVSDKEIVISTTYHTSERVIRFSLHPKSMIVGRVIASFDVPIK